MAKKVKDIDECPLCKLNAGDVRTRKYYKDGNWIIVDCDTCKIPMAVFAKHELVNKDRVRQIKAIARFIFPDCGFREEMRKIKDHHHFHVLIGGVK